MGRPKLSPQEKRDCRETTMFTVQDAYFPTDRIKQLRAEHADSPRT